MKIAIASDHAGFALKEALKGFLMSLSHDVSDLGTDEEESTDYPDYGFPLAEGVRDSKWEMGILVCRSGVGMSIVANKVSRVRAALCVNEETARLSREHNDSNVLVLGAMNTEFDLAKRILKIWLETSFLGGRHARRLEKIRSYERERSYLESEQDD